MLDLYDLIYQIRDKPGLYIGSASLRDFNMFLTGYQFARRQLKLPLSYQEQEFREFQPWLQRHLNLQTTQSWSDMILTQFHDDNEAFTKFFVLFELFLQERHKQLPSNGKAEAVHRA